MKKARSKSESKRPKEKNQTFSTEAVPAVQFIPEVSELMWSDLMEEETNDIWMLQLVEEIVSNVEEVCYAAYMERQVISFAVHCTYHSWMKIIGLHFLERDEGERNIEESPAWREDIEPDAACFDSWARGTIFTRATRSLTSSEPSLTSDISISDELRDMKAGESIKFLYVSPLLDNDQWSSSSVTLGCNSVCARGCYACWRGSGEHTKERLAESETEVTDYVEAKEPPAKVPARKPAKAATSKTLSPQKEKSKQPSTVSKSQPMSIVVTPSKLQSSRVNVGYAVLQEAATKEEISVAKKKATKPGKRRTSK